MSSTHNDNFKIEDVVDSATEDWKLPASIEDDEAMLGGKPLGMTLEEAKGTLGEATLIILV